jgi:hypothetical protein
MSKGLPVFITEYGACNTGTVLAEPQCTAWFNFLDSNKIGSTNWAVEYLDACLSIFTKSASYTGPWPDNVLTGYGTFIKAYITKGIDTPIGTGILNEAMLDPRGVAATSNGFIIGNDRNSAAVFNVNGMRCSTAGKLSSGLYVVRPQGSGSVRLLNTVR